MSDGLADVIAAKTVLSHADAENGTVWVRGHRIGDLVARYGYEGTIALIWEGFAGDDLTRGCPVECRQPRQRDLILAIVDHRITCNRHGMLGLVEDRMVTGNPSRALADTHITIRVHHLDVVEIGAVLDPQLVRGQVAAGLKVPSMEHESGPASDRVRGSP